MFAGTAGSVPSARRGLPAVLVRRGGERILIDCGEGTQRQLLRSVGLSDLTDIFLTHFHTDHWLGLPGLLQTFDLRDRERPLAIHGPRGHRRADAIMRASTGGSASSSRSSSSSRGSRCAAKARDRRRQRAPPRLAVGYVLVEDARPGPLRRRARGALGVTPGPDFGRLQRGETVNGVAPEQVIGAGAAGPQDRGLRRHLAVRDARGRRPPGRPAGARGDLRRGGARPRAPDRALDRRAGGADRPPRPRSSCSR